jgi:hypothetical protein
VSDAHLQNGLEGKKLIVDEQIKRRKRRGRGRGGRGEGRGGRGEGRGGRGEGEAKGHFRRQRGNRIQCNAKPIATWR